MRCVFSPLPLFSHALTPLPSFPSPKIFEEEEEKTVLGITAHSGVIRSVLEVVGHPPVFIPVAGVVPIFVKAERTG